VGRVSAPSLPRERSHGPQNRSIACTLQPVLPLCRKPRETRAHPATLLFSALHRAARTRAAAPNPWVAPVRFHYHSARISIVETNRFSLCSVGDRRLRSARRRQRAATEQGDPLLRRVTRGYCQPSATGHHVTEGGGGGTASFVRRTPQRRCEPTPRASTQHAAQGRRPPSRISCKVPGPSPLK